MSEPPAVGAPGVAEQGAVHAGTVPTDVGGASASSVS